MNCLHVALIPPPSRPLLLLPEWGINFSPVSCAHSQTKNIRGANKLVHNSRAFCLQPYYTATLFITARKLFIKVRKQKLFFPFFFLNISKIKLFIYLFFKQDTTTDPQNAKTCFVAVRAAGTEGQLISGPSRARPRKNTMINLKQTLSATPRGDECKKKKKRFNWAREREESFSVMATLHCCPFSIFISKVQTFVCLLLLSHDSDRFSCIQVAVTESALPFERFNTLWNNLNRCLLRATRVFRPRPCLLSHSVDLVFLTWSHRDSFTFQMFAQGLICVGSVMKLIVW